MSDNNRRVSYQPTGSRDVYWCHRLNEPVIVEYQHQHNGNERRSFCANCTQLDITDDDAHTFVCHVHKPPYAEVKSEP